VLTEYEKNLVCNYIDEYIDCLRMEVFILNRNRTINEAMDSIIDVVDGSFLIDKSADYDVLIKNPIEGDFFIPRHIDFYVTEINFGFSRANGFEITDFIDAGVVDQKSVAIDDEDVPDDVIRKLVSHMCFDIPYQAKHPEVRVAIADFFSLKHDVQIERIKSRLQPFLGINLVS